MNEPVRRSIRLSQLLVYVMVLVIILGMGVTVFTVFSRFASQELVPDQITAELDTFLGKVQVLVDGSTSVECFNKDCISDSGNDLKLRFADTTKDPTCVFLENGSVKVAQGPGPDGNVSCTSESQAMTSVGVTVYSLNFTKVVDAQGRTTVKTDAALAYTPRDTRIDIFLVIGLFVVGLFLIRSILSESKQKRLLAVVNKKLDSTNADLENLNEHLEQKVNEQTIEVRRAYEIEKQARIQLEELDKAKDQFTLTTQHHLRTPLTIVKGYLQSILDQKKTKLDPVTASYVAKAQESTERVASLVNELLDISQMEVGKSILSKTQVKVKDLVDSVFKELEAEIEKQGLSVKVDIQDGVALNLDERKIREALVNVIDNAIKYNKPKGSLTITGSRAIHPIEKSKQIYKIVVKDTGIGLTPEEAGKLFIQYFERGKEAEKLYTTGRGIGMAVTKNIIQAHGGKIYAESGGRNKGSSFTIELPID